MRIMWAGVALILSLVSAMAAAGELGVKAGEVVRLPGTEATIALTAVVDQRCPSDVDCYWEGLIRVEVTVTDGVTSQVIVLCNMCDEATREAVVAGRRVTLMRLEPGRDVLDRLSRLTVLADYSVVLLVE